MAAGAILRWTAHDLVPGVDLALVGLILIIAGVVGVLISLMTWTLRRWDELTAARGNVFREP